LGGDGGTGKSRLAMQLCCAKASGRDWVVGGPITKGRALFLSAEDDMEQLHRMLDEVARGMGFSPEDCRDVALGGLTEENAELCFAKIDKGQEQLTFTGMMARVEKLMEFERPSVTVFDSKVNFYGASENSRLLVTTFITRLRRAAKKCKT